jgi:serine/threonine-protein kinase
MTAASWSQISRLLDHALDLEPAAREPWLESLDVESPQVRETLRELLREQDRAQQLLRTLPELSEQQSACNVSAGEKVGPYRLLRELGAGGMASVWLAERADGSLKRQVALKLPSALSSHPGLTARLARERDILAGLEHPNIARLYDAGVDSTGRPYLALEYVDGVNLDVYLRERALSLRQRLELFLQITRAVAFAHARLVVHRDLKPSNILLTHAGEVRLLDFGIARLLQPEQLKAAHPTQVNVRAFTPGYAAPEQFLGEPITVATDVYSLGVLLYEMLTGVSPYVPKSEAAWALEQAVLTGEPRLPSSVVPGESSRALRGDLDAIVTKALKQLPSDRYATVDTFAADIERYLSGRPVTARRTSRWYVLRKFAQRNSVALGVSVVVTAAIVSGLGVALWQWQEANAQRVAAMSRLVQAEAALDFTTAVLTEGVRRDEPVSLDTLFSRSEAIVERMGRHDQMIRSIGTGFVADWYRSYGSHEQAEKLLTKTIDALPAERSSEKSRLICSRALAWYRMGRTDSAVASLAAEIERTRDDPVAAAYCLANRAALARLLSDGKSALAFALEAQRHYDLAGGQSAAARALLLNEIGYAHSLNGRPDLAQQFYRQAMDLFEARGQQETDDAAALRSNWGVALLSTGNPRQALRLFEQSRMFEERRSPTHEAPAFVIAGQATALQMLARHDEAMAAYELMRGIAARTHSSEHQVFALSGQASVAQARGRLDEAQIFLDQAAAIMSAQKVHADTKGAMRHSVIQARVWAAQGRSDDAYASLSKVIANYSRLGCCASARAQALVGRAEINLSNGRLDAAVADASQALQFAQQAQGRTSHSNITGSAWLSLGQIRQAQGRAELAGKAYALAAQHLSNTLGQEHPDTLRAKNAAGSRAGNAR